MKSPDLEAEEAMFSRLLKLRGQAEPVPELRQARARREVHAAWQRQVARRRRRRWITAVAAVLVGGLALGLVLRGLPLESPAAGRVDHVAGSLTVTRDGESVLLGTGSTGLELAVASQVATGERSLASLHWRSGHSVRLGPATSIEVVGPGTLRLESGDLYVDSGPIRRAQAIEVLTEQGVFREIGTQFMVSVRAGQATVHVRTGAVASDRVEAPVAAGERLTLGAGEVERAAIDPDDEVWDWTFAALGTLELDGRTLDDFLQWMAMENGWTLAYATPEIARRAARHTLSGVLEGLSAEEALAAVLRTFGLNYEFSGETLRITAPSD